MPYFVVVAFVAVPGGCGGLGVGPPVDRLLFLWLLAADDADDAAAAADGVVVAASGGRVSPPGEHQALPAAAHEGGRGEGGASEGGNHHRGERRTTIQQLEATGYLAYPRPYPSWLTFWTGRSMCALSGWLSSLF